MNWSVFVPLLITTTVAIIGWGIVYRLNVRRDQQNKRREIRVGYLIEAYRRLETGTCRGAIGGTEYGRDFESAIADIQLLGTEDQVRMAKELATAIAEPGKEANAGALLMSLRDSL